VHESNRSSEPNESGPATRMEPAGSLPILLAVVFVDLLGFSLILPLLPFYADSFGASPTQVGFLVASYAAMQFIGAPLLGGLSDRYGRRPVLILSIIGTAVGFLIFGLATSLWVLFASRMLDGLTGGNISVARAYIADVSPPARRARNFGLMGAAFGLGFIIGPAMGGFLSRWGFALPAFVAAAMAAMNAIAVFFFLPESHTAAARTLSRARRGKGGPSAFSQLLGGQRAAAVLWIRFYFSMAFVTFQTIFALFTQYRLDLNAEQTGYILGYIGVLIVLTQGVLVGPIAKRYSEGRIMKVAIAGMSVSLFAWAWVPSVPMLLLAMPPIALAGGVFNSVSISALSHSVEATEIGSVMGVSTSLESITRALAPSVGGILLGDLGTWAPGVFGSVLLVLLFPYAWVALRRPAPESAPA
jgi:MFS transporter, DHA1 family, tetracycline resistance protein